MRRAGTANASLVFSTLESHEDFDEVDHSTPNRTEFEAEISARIATDTMLLDMLTEGFLNGGKMFRSRQDAVNATQDQLPGLDLHRFRSGDVLILSGPLLEGHG